MPAEILAQTRSNLNHGCNNKKVPQSIRLRHFFVVVLLGWAI